MAADQGHAGSMNNYGHMLREGDGIPMNPQEACRYYKMAADQGDPDGIHNYRLMIRLILLFQLFSFLKS